jgi:hypothetical protein
MIQHLDKTKRNRYIQAALICCFFLVFFLQISMAGEKEPAYPELPLEEMRIAAYTKAFAARFGLPAPEPGTEPGGGLEAIEFAIEKGRFAPYYFGNFYLYLDNSLPIKYPEEGVAGEKYMLIRATHFFGRSHEQWMKWPENDRLHFNRRQGSYHRKANLASMNYIPGKQGAIADLYYREYHRDILPGLAYIKLDCSVPYWIIKKPRKNIGIWLQRESKTDYRGRIHVDPGVFLKFKIPDHVLRKVREWGLKADEVNDVYNSNFYREQKKRNQALNKK